MNNTNLPKKKLEKLFNDFPKISVLYVDKEGNVHFARNARKGMTTVKRSEIIKKGTKKN